MRYAIIHIAALLGILLQLQTVLGSEPAKVKVTPGTPNVWSMEQAHYLLNRLRANRDGLQTKKPSEDDLNPNAMNGLRLDALQQFLGVAGTFDQIGGAQNRVALDNFQVTSSRRRELIAEADLRRSQLQTQEFQLIQLTQDSANIKAKIAASKDPVEISRLTAVDAELQSKIVATNSTVSALRGQVAALTDAASGGSGAGLPPPANGTPPSVGSDTKLDTLVSPDPSYTKPIGSGLLADSFKTLLGATASSFGQPRLHASQFLDNFVQMQYEIVAKQLTTLRDEVGRGQRVVFLELPTAIDAGAQRKFPVSLVDGGQDVLAQVWWRLATLYLAYDRDTSPCWVGEVDVLHEKLGFEQGHDVDEVPKGLKISDSALVSRADNSLAVAELTRLFAELVTRRAVAAQALQRYSEAQHRSDLQAATVEALRRSATDTASRIVTLSRNQQPSIQFQLPNYSQLATDRKKSRDIEERELLARRHEESTIKALLDRETRAVESLLATIRIQEATVIGSANPAPDIHEYYSRQAQVIIAGLERPCREAHAAFSASQERFYREKDAFKNSKDSSEGIAERILIAQGALDRVTKDLKTLNDKLRQDSDSLAGDYTSRMRLQGEIARLKSVRSTTTKQDNEKRNLDAHIAQLEKEQSDHDAARVDLESAKTDIENRLKELENLTMAYQERKFALRTQGEYLNSERAQLLDTLERQQVLIYNQFGGSRGIHRAFKMNIAKQTETSRNDTGMVRTLEIFPRQTALNVNSTHVLSSTTAVSWAMKFVFGLGAKVDYERMREKYDQFVQQEVFASGFGKGSTEFGWTFGPNPGTRVLNPGERTTYAALTVPSNATGLELESNGCSFHHNESGLVAFPDEPILPWMRCMEHSNKVAIGLPDRDSSGSFWVTEVSYAKVKPGQRATIVLRGLFSPETNVLVNGKRLTQVVGLGKPPVTMDSGAIEDAGTGVIYGSYEYVNEHYLAISLNVPADYKDVTFPSVTLISPSRTATINSIPLVVNGEPATRLKDEGLLSDSKPSLTLAGVQVMESVPGPPSRIRARVSGTRLSAIDRVWINGTEIARKEPLSDTFMLIEFDDPGTLNWIFTVNTGDARPEDRTSVGLTIPNPVRLLISGVSASSVEYDKRTGAPVSATLLISGSAFTPSLTLTAAPGVSVSESKFMAPDQWYCKIGITNTKLPIILIFGDVSSTQVQLPKRPAEPSDGEKAKVATTVTEVQSQKTVTERKKE